MTMFPSFWSSRRFFLSADQRLFWFQSLVSTWSASPGSKPSFGANWTLAVMGICPGTTRGWRGRGSGLGDVRALALGQLFDHLGGEAGDHRKRGDARPQRRADHHFG